jgi:hypothetical protein
LSRPPRSLCSQGSPHTLVFPPPVPKGNSWAITKPVSPNLLYSYRKVIRESARARTHTYSCVRAANTYQLLGSAHSSPAMFRQAQSPHIRTSGSFIRPRYLPAAHGMQSLLGSSPDGTHAHTHKHRSDELAQCPGCKEGGGDGMPESKSIVRTAASSVHSHGPGRALGESLVTAVTLCASEAVEGR